MNAIHDWAVIFALLFMAVALWVAADELLLPSDDYQEPLEVEQPVSPPPLTLWSSQ